MNLVTCSMKIRILLLLCVMILVPLAKVNANYYYKVKLRDANGDIVKFKSSKDATELTAEWSGWIHNEAQLKEGTNEVKYWKNSLRDLVEGKEVEDEYGNMISLYDRSELTSEELEEFWNYNDEIKLPESVKRNTIEGIAFQGESTGDDKVYGILDGDDYYYTNGEDENGDENKINVFPKIKKDVQILDLSVWGKTFCKESYYFSGMSNLITLILPDNDFAIQDVGMFSDCENLQTVEWNTGTKITEIGKNAFSGCSNLPNEYIQQMINECAAYSGSNNKFIGEGAFRNCLHPGDKENGELTIPAGIIGIGKEAFKHDADLNNNLKKVTFSERTAGIEIGECAFDGCGLLRDVVLNGAKITALDIGAFKNNRVITSESVNAIIASFAENGKDENGEVDIPARLFEGCNGTSPTDDINFTNLVIPENVKTIGGCAFGQWEDDRDYLKEIVVSRKSAPECSTDEGYYNGIKYKHTAFNGVNPNHVTITFVGEAGKYYKSNDSEGYKSYMNDGSEFQRLLTKTLDEDNTDYDVFPQMHAIVKLKRTFKVGWNTLALPFGSPSSTAKDVDCAEIYKNALNRGSGNDFMIAVYRGLKKGTIFTFLKCSEVGEYPLDEFEPVLVKMGGNDIASDNIYTFENVDLNYDADNNELYAPEKLSGCINSEGNKFNGYYAQNINDNNMSFFHDNTYAEYYFDGTFYKRSGNDFISTGDYIIQGNKFIECDAGYTYGLKGFRGWFKKANESSDSKSSVFTIGLCDDNGTVTGIEYVSAQGESVRPCDIYNLNGQMVRADTLSVEGLAKGLYIVNGKKVVIK